MQVQRPYSQRSSCRGGDTTIKRWTYSDKEEVLVCLLIIITEDTAYISLSTFGKAVAEMFRGIPAHQSPKGCKLRVLALRVMPDHLHGVIQVLEPMPKSIGEVIRSYKSACTALYKKDFLSDDTFGRIFSERKSIWEHIASRDQERILHCEGQLDRMILYVKDNPRRLWLKHFNPDLFKLHNNLSFCFQDERGDEHTWKFRALGNLFLINAYQKQYLQCSRHATTQDIDNLLQAFSDRAELGAITITAAISEGEKTITKALRGKRFPLIVLLKDGFPKIGSRQERFFKPGGVYFDACAVGRLLLLEPYPEVLIEKAQIKCPKCSFRGNLVKKHNKTEGKKWILNMDFLRI